MGVGVIGDVVTFIYQAPGELGGGIDLGSD
jgi:hypothetical protein